MYYYQHYKLTCYILRFLKRTTTVITVVVELGINLGMFSLNVKGKENEEKTPLETRIEKLRLVVNYIDKKHRKQRLVDQPKTYTSRVRSQNKYFVCAYATSRQADKGIEFFGGGNSRNKPTSPPTQYITYVETKEVNHTLTIVGCGYNA